MSLILFVNKEEFRKIIEKNVDLLHGLPVAKIDGYQMIRLKIKEILDKMYSDDIITNVTYVTIL